MTTQASCPCERGAVASQVPETYPSRLTHVDLGGSVVHECVSHFLWRRADARCFGFALAGAGRVRRTPREYAEEQRGGNFSGAMAPEALNPAREPATLELKTLLQTGS